MPGVCQVRDKMKIIQRVFHLISEISLWLNMAGSISLVLLVRGFIFLETQHGYQPETAFKYYFLRATGRLADFLSLRHFPRTSQELTVLVCVACLTAIILAASQLLSGSASPPFSTHRVSGALALLAFPAAWSYAAHLAVHARAFSEQSVNFWLTPIGIIISIDLVAIIGFVLLLKPSTYPGLYRIIFVAHYGMWTWIVVETWKTIGRLYIHRFIALSSFCLTHSLVQEYRGC